MERRTVRRPTPHGVGGLKYNLAGAGKLASGPTPHGVGGLKYDAFRFHLFAVLSHPSRGGWIEMEVIHRHVIFFPRPTPHGVGGLKYHYSNGQTFAPLVPPLTGWVD